MQSGTNSRAFCRRPIQAAEEFIERSNCSTCGLAGAEAQTHLMGFIGTAEAVPLLQSRVARTKTSYSAACIATKAGWAAVAALIALVAAGAMLDAQNPAPPTVQPDSQPLRPMRNPPQRQNLTTAKPSPSTPAPEAAQTPQPEPPNPDWPVNNKPTPATITWDTNGLVVEANNSSLDEILKEVATRTGAKLEGRVSDERVFGSYGPGPARNVVMQLLDGTPYNVMMLGDQGEGTPREIVLSNRPTGAAPVNAPNNSEDETEYEQPQQPIPGIPPVRGTFGPQGMPPEQNQNLIEERRAEIEQRQEQMRQQQEQQQQQQQQQQQPQPPQQ